MRARQNFQLNAIRNSNESSFRGSEANVPGTVSSSFKDNTHMQRGSGTGVSENKFLSMETPKFLGNDVIRFPQSSVGISSEQISLNNEQESQGSSYAMS